MLNIRVRRIKPPGTPPSSARDVRDALQTLLDTGRMPRGWQFMAVNWKNPKRFGSDWRSGWPTRQQSDDADEFIEAFREVVQSEIRSARVLPL